MSGPPASRPGNIQISTPILAKFIAMQIQHCKWLYGVYPSISAVAILKCHPHRHRHSHHKADIILVRLYPCRPRILRQMMEAIRIHIPSIKISPRRARSFPMGKVEKYTSSISTSIALTLGAIVLPLGPRSHFLGGIPAESSGPFRDIKLSAPTVAVSIKR